VRCSEFFFLRDPSKLELEVGCVWWGYNEEKSDGCIGFDETSVGSGVASDEKCELGGSNSIFGRDARRADTEAYLRVGRI